MPAAADRRPPLAVARGCTRLTILAGPWAIKVPNVLRGWRDALWGLLWNMLERETAARGTPGVCPILWSVPGGFLSVMPRARTLTDAEFRLHYHALFGEGVERPYECQPKPDSFGFLPDGRLVCVDYAP